MVTSKRPNIPYLWSEGIPVYFRQRIDSSDRTPKTITAIPKVIKRERDRESAQIGAWRRVGWIATELPPSLPAFPLARGSEQRYAYNDEVGNEHYSDSPETEGNGGGEEGGHQMAAP